LNLREKIDYYSSKFINKLTAEIKDNGREIYWWVGKKNFGDLITPEIVKGLGFTPVHAHINEAEFIGAGSLLQMLSTDSCSQTLGTGLISNTYIDLPNVKFVSVRGELTKDTLDLPSNTPTGDIGLIADELITGRSIKKRYSLGIVPHYVDKSSAWVKQVQAEYGTACLIIDVEQSASNVTKRVAMCDMIVSSSLHGIIVADSLGIPNIWVELSNKVFGGGFKFEDYASSINSDITKYRPNELKNNRKIEQNMSARNNLQIRAKKEEIKKLLVQSLSI